VAEGRGHACQKEAREVLPPYIQPLLREGGLETVLGFLRLHDIVAFHLSSSTCHRSCRSPRTLKLLVPVFFMQRRWLRHVDLPTVDALYADDLHMVSLAENEEFVSCVAACACLKHLFCSRNGHIMAAPLARALTCIPGLVSLDLAHNRLAVDERFSVSREQPLGPLFSALQPKLQFLDLSYNLLRDEHAHQLVEALEASFEVNGGGLQHLLVRSNYLANGAGFAFGHLMRTPAGAELRRMDLRTNQVQEEGACAMLKALRSHPSMREVRVGYNRQNEMQSLETATLACVLLQRALSSGSCNRLELLDLNNVRMGDEGVCRIAAALAGNRLLKRLDVAFNSIGLKGAAALAGALEHNQMLQELDLRDNELGDEGAEAMAVKLKKNQTLTKLKLARNGISARGAVALRTVYQENSNLAVDFGASGAQLQGMVRRNTPRMADLQLMRDSMRGTGEISNFFAC